MTKQFLQNDNKTKFRYDANLSKLDPYEKSFYKRKLHK